MRFSSVQAQRSDLAQIMNSEFTISWKISFRVSCKLRFLYKFGTPHKIRDVNKMSLSI